jgi:CRISPR-associated endonuclease Csn1
MVSVSMLEATQRIKNRQPVICRTHPTIPNATFLFSLSWGEMILLKHKSGENYYRYITSASTSKQMWFRKHTVATQSTDKRGEVSVMPSTLDARKVLVDPLGRVRWAND